MSPAQAFAQLFKRTPAEAVRVLQQRGEVAVTYDWRDMWEDEHARQFTVSRLARLDLLKSLHEGIVKSVDGDLSRRDWTRNAKALLTEAGWWGENTVLDPATGEAVTTVFDPSRLKLIFDMNTRSAYSAGLWERVQRAKATHPYVRYITKRDERVRASHRQWDNLTLPVDHPLWQTIWPPNGWRCRCRVMSMSQAEYDRRREAGQLNTTAPTLQLRDWTNGRTGEVSQVPVGIDPGFAYNPGMASLRAAGLARVVGEKLAAAPAGLGAAAWQGLQNQALPLLAETYRQWLAELAESPRAKSIRPVIGAVAPEELMWLAENGRAVPATAQISVSSAPIVGPKATRHAAKGDALSTQVWERLPELLAEPLAVLLDTGSGNLVYVLPDRSARRGQVVVEFDYLRRESAGNNVVVSGYRPLLKDITDRVGSGDLVLIRGTLTDVL